LAQKLRVGDRVIYPAHGAGVIEAIEQKVISGSEQTVYVMRMLHNGLTVLIPVGNQESIGIRDPMSLKEIERTYAVLGNKDHRSDEHPETWNRRYRKYREKIRTGTALEIAGVLKTLHETSKTRTLSLMERRIADTAMDLLVGEVSCVKDMKEGMIRKEIELLLEGE
jgi:CarD family transcriptional regulator